MAIKALVDKCRYYKGESECPESIVQTGKRYLWEYEKRWVELGGNYLDNGEYDYAELIDFEKDDGVDLTLKMLLFNRYIQDSSLATSIEPFKEWYKTEYKGRV